MVTTDTDGVLARLSTKLGIPPTSPERDRRALAREIDDFARQVGRAVAGKPISRFGRTVRTSETAPTLLAWYDELNQWQQRLRPQRSWRPLGALIGSKHKLVEWYDGTPRQHVAGGGALRTSEPVDTGAITTRTGPLPEHPGMKSDTYYDNPIHDR